MRTEKYNRTAAVEYAKKWSLKRNPDYFNFDGIGGDCTNFASQCLYAGSGVMNYTRDTGWYYINSNNRAAAWSGAQYFFNFMTSNSGVGPTALRVDINELEAGDFIQLYNGTEFYHTLIVTGFSGNEPLICAHTRDAYMMPLKLYTLAKPYPLHITGINAP